MRKAGPASPQQPLTTQVVDDANHKPGRADSKSGRRELPRARQAFPCSGLRLGLRAPKAFTWPFKVHAHRAQLGRWARRACTLWGPKA